MSLKDFMTKPKEVIAEDDTGIPFLTLGGVFTNQMGSVSELVSANDKQSVQKLIVAMFIKQPAVNANTVKEIADRGGLTVDMINNEIYEMLGSLLNGGKFAANPNMPIDDRQLQMGIAVEAEHTDNYFLRKKISLDHLSEMSDYYTKLKEMEDKYSGGVKVDKSEAKGKKE
jgi:hypothetical protein